MAKIIWDPQTPAQLPHRIGDVYIRQTATGPVAYMRRNAKQKLHPRQQLQIDKFKRAAAYASAIINDPEKKKVYMQNLHEGETVYRAAMKEFLRRPG